MHLLQHHHSGKSDTGGTASSRGSVLWVQSRAQPLRLAEIVQAVVILAFAFAMPILAVPTIAVLLIVLLERLGLTLPGKSVVLAVVGAITWLTLIALAYLTGR